MPLSLLTCQSYKKEFAQPAAKSEKRCCPTLMKPALGGWKLSKVEVLMWTCTVRLQDLRNELETRK